jgi:copper(I)-binding protein
MKSLIIVLFGAIAWCCAAASGSEVTVSSPWVRATAPGQTVAGAYLKITSATTAYLVGGSSTAAKSVELHQMTLENNVMKMRPLARLELPAGTAVELKPGGYHLMLVDVVRPLAKGDSVAITLTVEDQNGRRRSVDVKAEVGELVAAGGRHGT